MKHIINQAFFAISGLMLAALSAAPALAMRDGETINLSALRHQAATRQPAAGIVRIEGALKCDYGTEKDGAGAVNNGQGCALKIHQAETGKTFNLVEARDAMKLYINGARNVAVEGTLADPETLQVRKAETL